MPNSFSNNVKLILIIDLTEFVVTSKPQKVVTLSPEMPHPPRHMRRKCGGSLATNWREVSDMSIDGKEIVLATVGTAIVFHSPKSTEHIQEGDDYLQSSYSTEDQVQSHIQKGTLVGFGTGSPGTFVLRFHSGYPSDEFLVQSDFKLRLGLSCFGGAVCFRDLYELLDWKAECPSQQVLELDDGVYHITLCSNRPASGIIGDNQVIHCYLQMLDRFPDLAKQGVPTLCM
ncbi:MAG: hypothetical protein ACO1RA_16005 [Planctomycetaceae bacterium]